MSWQHESDVAVSAESRCAHSFFCSVCIETYDEVEECARFLCARHAEAHGRTAGCSGHTVVPAGHAAGRSGHTEGRSAPLGRRRNGGAGGGRLGPDEDDDDEEAVAAEILRVQSQKFVMELEIAEIVQLGNSVEQCLQAAQLRIAANFALHRELLLAAELRAASRARAEAARAARALGGAAAARRLHVARLEGRLARLHHARRSRGPLSLLRHLEDASLWESTCSPWMSLDASRLLLWSRLDPGAICSSAGIGFEHLHSLLVSTYGRSPTLNPNSAHRSLLLSADLRSASLALDPPRRPAHRDRFDVLPQALAARGFSSGRHYWEADVGGARGWRLGAAYGSLARKGGGGGGGGGDGRLGRGGDSWCLESWAGALAAWHGDVEVAVRDAGGGDGGDGGGDGGGSARIGVYLDYERGLLAFYSRLYPAIGLWIGSLALCELP
uniref:Probable E3 ubiquitin-protein ligase TRIML2 n=1 Tax=Petromyzon marinus TaxID=7757 RepID=A0AAJ7XK50_PETMA|nr:probable E3 ubiquitin-protein ligase TRIML2 [Petromyzon marinus]